MLPLFERMLKNQEITAWVAESDYLGIKAIDFLRERNIRVPQDISIIGFDDIIEGFGVGLTSFDFNVPGLIHAILNHIALAKSVGKIINTGPVEIPGILLERITSGKVKKR